MSAVQDKTNMTITIDKPTKKVSGLFVMNSGFLFLPVSLH